MKRLLICSVMVLAAVGKSAADAVTNEAVVAATNGVALERLVAQTLGENPELQFYRAEIAAAKAGRKVAGLWANPELSGAVGQKKSRDLSSGLSAVGVAWSVSLTRT